MSLPSEVGELKVYSILHDHGAPNLTGSTIAIVHHSAAEGISPQTPANQIRPIDVYLDPTLDFQFDPNLLPNSKTCHITDNEEKAKLQRAIEEVVPRLEGLPANTPRNIRFGFDLSNPLGKPTPTRGGLALPTFPVLTPAPVSIGTRKVTCVVVAEDRNDQDRLILGVLGLPLVRGVEPASTVVIVQTPTPTP
jgi:hypothetical protein